MYNGRNDIKRNKYFLFMKCLVRFHDRVIGLDPNSMFGERLEGPEQSDRVHWIVRGRQFLILVFVTGDGLTRPRALPSSSGLGPITSGWRLRPQTRYEASGNPVGNYFWTWRHFTTQLSRAEKKKENKVRGAKWGHWGVWLISTLSNDQLISQKRSQVAMEGT